MNVQFENCETQMQRVAAWIAADKASILAPAVCVLEVCGFWFHVNRCKTVTKIRLKA